MLTNLNGPVVAIGSIFLTFLFNLIVWSLKAGTKLVQETRVKVDAHETDIVVLYNHLGLQRPTLR